MALRETLDVSEELDRVWCAVCKTYDVSAERPDMEVLLESVDLSAPRHAAVTVLVNMLSEVIECIGRFSPWYKTPARGFGLVSYHDDHYRLRWTLTPEACCEWADVLAQLEIVLRRNTGVLLASEWVDRLMMLPSDPDPCVLAQCACEPPHIIIIEESALAKHGVFCNTCQQPYQQIAMS